MNICIIRHGETDWNIMGKFQGREDIPLNENGIYQATQCGLTLKQRKWDKIFSSPLLRAKKTAEIIADINGIATVYVDEDLTERDYGEASGLTVEEQKIHFPNDNYKGVEDWEELKTRVYNALLRCIDKSKDEDIIIVSHGKSINAILSKVSNDFIGEIKIPLKNTCLNMLEYKDNDFRILFYDKLTDEIIL